MTDDTRLRAIWADLPEGGEHVDEAEWERFACGEQDAPARARMLDHVVACPACTTAYRAVIALAAEARRLDPSLPAPSPAPRPRSRRGVWWAASAAFAAAAAVLLAIGLLPDRPAVETLRGERSAEVVVEAAGPRIGWRPVDGADGYRVRVHSQDGRVAWSTTAPAGATEMTWAGATGAEPGVYTWSVEALQGEDVVARSRLTSFTIAR